MHPPCQIATVRSARLVKCLGCSSSGNRGSDGVLTQSSFLPWKNIGRIGKLGKLLSEGMDTMYRKVSKDSIKWINLQAPPWISSIKSIFERWVRLTSVTVPVLSLSCLAKSPNWHALTSSRFTLLQRPPAASSKLGSLHLLNFSMPLPELLFSCAWCDPWISMVIFWQGLGSSPSHEKGSAWLEHFGPPPLHMSPESESKDSKAD